MIPVVLVVSLALSAQLPSLELEAGVSLRPLAAAQASAVLETRDEFVASLSPFDRSSRLKTSAPVTEKAYLSFVSSQSRDFTAAEAAHLKEAVAQTRVWLGSRAVMLPAEVELVKTTGLEEGDAPYTRGTAVILPQDVLAKGTDELAGILVHELFHVMTRANPALREQLYAAIGFRRCGKLALPGALQDLAITNPDAPGLAYSVSATDASLAGDYVPILFARSQYDDKKKGEFFEYLTFEMLEVEASQGECKPVMKGAGLILVSLGNLPSVMNQIGRNTDYVLHPEEILAENFVLLVRGKKDVPSPEILQRLGKILWPQAAK